MAQLAGTGIRSLRADLAAHVRRAAAGQAVLITVDGRAVARLGPVEGTDSSMDALVAAGLVLPPRRSDSARPGPPVPIWSGVRLDRALRELRG